MNSWKEFAGHCNQRQIAASAVKQHPILQILTSQPSSKLGSCLNYFSPTPLSEGRFEDNLSSIAFSTQIHQEYHFDGGMSLTSQFSYFSPPQSLQPHQKPSVSGEDKDSKSPVLGRKHPLCGKELLSQLPEQHFLCCQNQELNIISN